MHDLQVRARDLLSHVRKPLDARKKLLKEVAHAWHRIRVIINGIAADLEQRHGPFNADPFDHTHHEIMTVAGSARRNVQMRAHNEDEGGVEPRWQLCFECRQPELEPIERCCCGDTDDFDRPRLRIAD